MKSIVCILSCIFPILASASCIENGFDVPINYWYYQAKNEKKCIKKIVLEPLESICTNEKNRNVHFMSLNKGDEDWYYFEYIDKSEDKIILNEEGLKINDNNIIKRKKTSINLKKSKVIQFCDEPLVEVNKNNCCSNTINMSLKNEIALTIMKYTFSDHHKTNRNYKEILVESAILDIAKTLKDVDQLQISTSYRFDNFLHCEDLFTVELISYSAPKASSKKLFILKFVNGYLKIIKEELIWIS